ncbi:hypothetical protein NE237_005945 [Protea cynaroides]|uniref:Large ribosomal subunit protein mL54 n=1 Tax=Protea cynaroides TaxID=273540 RepID=A0A9Q0KM78_9MAGN|nr:hypothetical protein NE237_005945 [Protea cynaroides]
MTPEQEQRIRNRNVIKRALEEKGIAHKGCFNKLPLEHYSYNPANRHSDTPHDSIVLLGLEMATSNIRAFKFMISKEAVGMVGCRTFSAGGGKAKKGSKGGAAGDGPKASTLSKEVKSTIVVGANTLKEGVDPKVMPDSEYPEWLWHLLDKRVALSELRRKNQETLPYEELKRFVKLDNRARIKDNNSVKAKN